MRDLCLFKWRHFEAEIILCAERWYLCATLSDCDVEEFLQERGLAGDQATIFRWVHRYAPGLGGTAGMVR